MFQLCKHISTDFLCQRFLKSFQFKTPSLILGQPVEFPVFVFGVKLRKNFHTFLGHRVVTFGFLKLRVTENFRKLNSNLSL